jgi:hypothetical protein
MPIATTTASPWPGRCAYISATIFIAASGATNITYGWSKGDSLATSVVWAGVAGAVAAVLALSVPALMRSVEARRWSAAVMALAALLLSGTYSVTAALGSAAGGRQNAATVETASFDARKRLQSAYEAAKAELDALRPSRAVGELEALVAGAKLVCREVQDFKSRRTECSPPAALVAELGRAKRRVELEGKVERAADELAKVQPARIANSDAKALTRYLGALGFEVSPDRLNNLLVLLAVLTIETGGGLSLIVAPCTWRTRFAKSTPIIVSDISPSSPLRVYHGAFLAHCDTVGAGRQPSHLN